MTPLRHPPVFSEPVYGMETTGADTAELAGWLFASLAGDAGHSPEWLVEAGSGLPGHIGKRRNWVSLSVAAWPQLAVLTSEPWLTLSAVES